MEDTNKDTDNIVNTMASIAAVAEESSASTEEVSASAEEINATMTEFNETALKLKELSQELKRTTKYFYNISTSKDKFTIINCKLVLFSLCFHSNTNIILLILL